MLDAVVVEGMPSVRLTYWYGAVEPGLVRQKDLPALTPRSGRVSVESV